MLEKRTINQLSIKATSLISASLNFAFDESDQKRNTDFQSNFKNTWQPKKVVSTLNSRTWEKLFRKKGFLSDQDHILNNYVLKRVETKAPTASSTISTRYILWLKPCTSILPEVTCNLDYPLAVVKLLVWHFSTFNCIQVIK